MGLKINEYPLERLSLGDDDYIDIDYFNGANYESAKIKGQVFKSIVASEPNIVIVSDSSDLPASLQPNTTYVINGSITTSQAVTIASEGSAIIGRDRNKDKITYTGTGAFLTITEVSFTMRGITLSATDSNSSLISATNINASGYNFNRLKTISISACQIRNVFDIFQFTGFDLIDIQNTLFWYCQAQNFGVVFEDTSKIQIQSCEFIRWFDETTIPTPGNFASVSMIKLRANNVATSYGAVNFTGSIFHPQDVQNGIEIESGATIGYGTIVANTFVKVGLTGEILLPIISAGIPDYSATQMLTFDIMSNQGLLNSTSGVVMTLNGNTTNTALSSGVPALVNTNNNAISQVNVRYTIAGNGRCTYDGTKQVYVSIHATISYDKQGGGSDDYIFYLYKNGTQLAGSQVTITGGGDASELSTSLNYGTLMENSDYIEIWVENAGSNDDILIRDIQLVIRE